LNIKGDVLVRVFHLPFAGAKKILLFRFSFHTAFLEGGVLSLSEADLSAEKRFAMYRSGNFFTHLFFDEPGDQPSKEDIAQNVDIESYSKLFQKIYSERKTLKLDALDPNSVAKLTPPSSLNNSGNTITNTSITDPTATNATTTTTNNNATPNIYIQTPLPPESDQKLENSNEIFDKKQSDETSSENPNQTTNENSENTSTIPTNESTNKDPSEIGLDDKSKIETQDENGEIAGKPDAE